MLRLVLVLALILLGSFLVAKIIKLVKNGLLVYDCLVAGDSLIQLYDDVFKDLLSREEEEEGKYTYVIELGKKTISFGSVKEANFTFERWIDETLDEYQELWRRGLVADELIERQNTLRNIGTEVRRKRWKLEV